MGTTSHTVDMMGKVDNEVQAGTQVVMHTEKVFGKITEKVQQVSEQIQKRYLCLQMKLQRAVRRFRLSAEDIAQISQRSSDRTDRVKESIQQQENLFKRFRFQLDICITQQEN